MDYVYFAAKLAVAVFVLNVIYKQSYNLLFFYLKRPHIWMTTVFLLGLVWFYTGRMFNWSFNLVWWASLIVLMLNIPPKSKISRTDLNEFSDDFTNIKNSIRKGRLGLLLFAIGCILGWIVVWGETCDGQGICRRIIG